MSNYPSCSICRGDIILHCIFPLELRPRRGVALSVPVTQILADELTSAVSNIAGIYLFARVV